MSVRFDDKGKYFTSIVTKEPKAVILQTLLHRIEGNIHTRRDERLKEAVNVDGEFIAVTDAIIYNSQGMKVFENDFILVNSEHIVWIYPIINEDE